jgi:hypothetical protein
MMKVFSFQFSVFLTLPVLVIGMSNDVQREYGIDGKYRTVFSFQFSVLMMLPVLVIGMNNEVQREYGIDGK